MYEAINEHRMPYDIDGTAVGHRAIDTNISVDAVLGLGMARWLDATEKSNLNKEDKSQAWGEAGYRPRSCFWFFFPEIREVTHLGFIYPNDISAPSSHLIQGSLDTTNGMDGTWETAVYTLPAVNGNYDSWRAKIFPVSFSGPVKALRMGMGGNTGSIIKYCGIHIYGRKASGQQLDDIVFTDSSGAELTALKDFGDQSEGTTEIQSFRIKNASASKIANNVNIQLNHADFSISFSQEGPWQSVLDISSIGPGSLSSTVYVRNLLGPPLLSLGPKAARAIVTVGSWI